MESCCVCVLVCHFSRLLWTCWTNYFILTVSSSYVHSYYVYYGWVWLELVTKFASLSLRGTQFLAFWNGYNVLVYTWLSSLVNSLIESWNTSNYSWKLIWNSWLGYDLAVTANQNAIPKQSFILLFGAWILQIKPKLPNANIV